MEILAVVVLYLIIKFFTSSNNTPSHEMTNRKNHSMEHELQLRVLNTDKVVEGERINILRFYVSGLMKNRTKRIRLTLTAFDVTENREHILSLYTDLREEKSESFLFSTQWINIEFENAYYPEEVVLVEIPCESFVFPKKGKRKVEFLLNVEDSNNTVANKAAFKIELQNNVLGYIDSNEGRIKAENAIVRMSLFIAGIDNVYQQVEVDMIKNFVKELSTNENSVDSIRMKALNDIVRNTIIHSKSINVKSEIGRLTSTVKDNADNYLKHQAIVFFMQLVSSDGNYSKEEHELIDFISKGIDFDNERIRDLKDKIISVSIHDDLSDTSTLLGLTNGMSSDEKKKHLREEYKKWNQRVTHSDPAIRDQATRMLELIAQERSKL